MHGTNVKIILYRVFPVVVTAQNGIAPDEYNQWTCHEESKYSL